MAQTKTFTDMSRNDLKSGMTEEWIKRCGTLLYGRNQHNIVKQYLSVKNKFLKQTCDTLSPFPGGTDSKESACNAGEPGLIPWLERSPGKGNGYPLYYSCVENSTAIGAWCPWGHKELDMIEWLSLSLLILPLKKDAVFIYNGILFNHKKEWNNAICSNMDEPKEYHTKWSKSDREKQISHEITHMWNLIF